MNPVKIQKSTRCGVGFLLTSAAVAILGVAGSRASSVTWDGGSGGAGTSWNDPVDWSGDNLPGSADTVYFTGAVTANKVISLDANQAINRLAINSYSGVTTFTIGSAADILAGYTLTLTNVFRGDNNGNSQTIAANVKLAADSNWNIVNGYNGNMSVTGGIGSDSAVTFTKDGSNTLTVNGANTFTGSLRVIGGTLSLGGTSAYTGTTTASGGTLQLNFNTGTAPLTDIINSSSVLVVGGVHGGGTVTASGKNLANVVNSQTFSGLTVNAGATTFNIANGISSGKTLVALGAIARNAGGTVNFVQPTTNTTIGSQNGYTTSTSNDATGILGAYATVGGTEYAANNGTNIVAYTGYTDQVGNTMADSATTNLRITSGTTGNITQGTGMTTVNTIRVNDATARTITVGTGNTLRTNGVLATGTSGLTVGEAANAGTLTAGSADNTAAELVINNTTAVGVNSVIANNGTGAVSLTKAGSGTLTLNATNTYTGGTYVTAGTLALTAGSTDQLSTAGDITITGGTFNLGSGTGQTTSGNVIIAGGTLSNGTLTDNGAAFDVRSGTISTKLAGTAGLNKTTSGILTFTNTVSNTYTGTTTISEGSVIGGSAANVTAISGDLVVGTSDGSGSGASFLQGNNNVTFNSAKNLTVYSNGSVNFGGGAQNLNGVITIIGGSVSGSQIYLNSTVNMTGGSYSGTSYGNNGSFTTNASADTASISAAIRSGGSTKTFSIADGAAAVDALMSGDIATGNVTKTGAGYMSMTGTKAYTGVTTISGGTLAADTLANGGSNSSIGSSSNAASNLKFGNGTIFEYTGAGSSTDRLFTINGSSAGDSATLKASGTGAANFTNTGSIAYGTGSQTRTLKLGGTSTADNTLALLIANNGSGVVSLTKQDAGKWILTNANTYTGATTISGGTLVVNGSLASGSAVSIGASGTLGGSGTISGTVAVAGTLSPGNSPGLLTTGAETWSNGGSYNWQVVDATGVAGTGFDSITITSGGLNLSGLTAGGFSINLWSLSGTGPDVNGDAMNFDNSINHTWTLVSNTGDLTSVAGSDFVVNVGASNGTAGFSNALGGGVFSVMGTLNSLDLVFTAAAIPEPSTWAMLLGVLALAGSVWRRRGMRT